MAYTLNYQTRRISTNNYRRVRSRRVTTTLNLKSCDILRHPRTDQHAAIYKEPTPHFRFFRTYSIRICLQKLTESRIFTNAAFFKSARWHPRHLVLLRTWLHLFRWSLEDVWFVFLMTCKSCREFEPASLAFVWWITYTFIFMYVVVFIWALKFECTSTTFNASWMIVSLSVVVRNLFDNCKQTSSEVQWVNSCFNLFRLFPTLWLKTSVRSPWLCCFCGIAHINQPSRLDRWSFLTPPSDNPIFSIGIPKGHLFNFSSKRLIGFI